MTKKNDSANWISLSDMMTGLMLIFLFIAIVAISDVRSIAQEYQDTRGQIYQDLETAFNSDKENWSMELDEDTLSIRFTNPDLLFSFDSASLRQEYKRILDEFIPKYLGVITKPEYQDDISEIRIEGHTSQERLDTNYYFMYNINLSQERSNSVLDYILNSDAFNSISPEDQDQVKFWITANGLGYSRALDEDGKLVFNTEQNQDREQSRRVEFRILTNSEDLLKEITE